MSTHFLVMKWDYTYDKESTWFDEESGESRYELIAGASYALPHIRKTLEITSVTIDGERITAELCADHQTHVVRNNGEAVVGRADDDYMVAGDSVSQTLCMTFTIE